MTKPAPRWSLVVGKYLGVVLFVALHAVLFVGGTWQGYPGNNAKALQFMRCCKVTLTVQ